MDDRLCGRVDGHLHPADRIGEGSDPAVVRRHELEEQHGMDHVLELLLTDQPRLEAERRIDCPCNRLRAQDLTADRMRGETRGQVDGGAEEAPLSLDDAPPVDADTRTREVRLALDRLAQANRGLHHREGVGAGAEDFVADAVDDRDPGAETRPGELDESEDNLGGLQRAMGLGERRVSAEVGDQKGQVKFARSAHCE